MIWLNRALMEDGRMKCLKKYEKSFQIGIKNALVFRVDFF